MINYKAWEYRLRCYHVKWPKLTKTIPGVAMAPMPHGWGIVYLPVNMYAYVIAPIPLNLLFRYTRQAYYTIWHSLGLIHELPEHRIYAAAYAQGRKDALKEYNTSLQELQRIKSEIDILNMKLAKAKQLI